MFVSIVVPTFRRPEALRATLSALAALEYPDDLHEVLVVDDGREAEAKSTVGAVQQERPCIHYLRPDSQGVAGARNFGASRARGELLILLDDDILVEPSHVLDHLATREAYGDCIVNGHWEFSPEVLQDLQASPFGRFRISVEDWVKQGIQKTPLGGACVEPEEVTACNLGIRRQLFWDLGGFDEQFPSVGSEDQDFSHRAKAAGCRFVYSHDIRLLHNDRRLTLAEFGARQEYTAKGAVLLALKHPERFADRPLITENSPISRSDPLAVAAKKAVKLVLSPSPMLAAERWAIRLLERLHAPWGLLRRAYWSVCGIYIFRGIRAGLRARRASELARAA